MIFCFLHDTDRELLAQGRRQCATRLKHCLLAALVCLLGGCSTVSYYSQIVSGHMRIVVGKKSLDEVVADAATDETTRHKIEVAKQAREFAIGQLFLPDNGSYKSFYDTRRDYVTYNVVAADEFSFKAQQWCFPIAGCVSYRGYYAKEDAEAYARGLSEQGLDVAVNGATAYSTLGWFADPLLNTMLRRSDASITSLLFHELAHQQLYVGDDSKFNESFASFVESAGMTQWQKKYNQGDASAADAIRQRHQRQVQFVNLLSSTRADLQAIYDSGLSISVMREKKAEQFSQLLRNYESLKETWGGYRGYDGWFNRKLNNARLVSVATYNDYIPAFQVLFEESGSDFRAFYSAARVLADMEPGARTKAMEALLAKAES